MAETGGGYEIISKGSAPVARFNPLARIIAKLTDSRVVLLGQKAQSKYQIIGAFGSSVTELPIEWEVPKGDNSLNPCFVIKNVHAEPALINHPLRTVFPPVKSAMVVDVQNDEINYCILAIDPDLKSVSDPNTMNGIHELCRNYQPTEKALADQGFKEPSNNESLDSEYQEIAPASHFLLSTLLKQTKLHTVDSHHYFTIRKWRKSIKPHQLSALKALKHSPACYLSDQAAEEIFEMAEKVNPGIRFAHVVPVPCGSSGGKCISTKIAQSCAKIMDVAYSPVLKNIISPTAGSSHPKKSAKHKGFKLTEQLQGPILLVDDVATTGRHMQLAIDTLKTCQQPLTPIAWIGRD